MIHNYSTTLHSVLPGPGHFSAEELSKLPCQVAGSILFRGIFIIKEIESGMKRFAVKGIQRSVCGK